MSTTTERRSAMVFNLPAHGIFDFEQNTTSYTTTPSPSSKRMGRTPDELCFPSPPTALKRELSTKHYVAQPIIRPVARQAAAQHIRLMPYTDAEWKHALADLKRDYSTAKYRSCVTKCKELLNAVKNPKSVQPTYLIYLHFYAATAIEMQVRGFQASSPHRIKFLQDARHHYRLASSLAQAADEQVATARSLFHSSRDSSIGSPVSSILSMTSDASSSRASSPALSVATTRSTKRVTFVDGAPGMDVDEPFVRPDSPTLGLDDPVSGRTSPCFEDTSNMATPRALQREWANEEDEYTLSSEPSVAFTRYCTTLNSIQQQINTHLQSIEQDIDAALYPRPGPPLDDEMRAIDLQARILRLRANGWARKRFDAHRYESVREQAILDMMQ